MIHSFHQWLNEVGENIADVNWVKTPKRWVGYFTLTKDNTSAEFEIDISVRPYCDNTDVWEFSFTRDKTAKMFNDNKFNFIVYPTINKAVQDFIHEIVPETFGFLGDKDDTSRDRVYGSTSKILSSRFDYKYDRLDVGSHYAYILYKDNAYEECIENLKSMKK